MSWYELVKNPFHFEGILYCSQPQYISNQWVHFPEYAVAALCSQCNPLVLIEEEMGLGTWTGIAGSQTAPATVAAEVVTWGTP